MTCKEKNVFIIFKNKCTVTGFRTLVATPLAMARSRYPPSHCSATATHYVALHAAACSKAFKRQLTRRQQAMHSYRHAASHPALLLFRWLNTCSKSAAAAGNQNSPAAWQRGTSTCWQHEWLDDKRALTVDTRESGAAAWLAVAPAEEARQKMRMQWDVLEMKRCEGGKSL